jgi:signal transduction histidine kinase/CheY-like chemotaxis protein
MTGPILTLTIQQEHHVVAARRRARQIAELLGFDAQDQIRIATAVSEIARNALKYGGGGKVDFAAVGGAHAHALEVKISDRGPGVADLQAVLDGRYHSPTGMGIGIIGARRLMEDFEITSAAGGTTVRMRKSIPVKGAALTPATLARISEELARPKSEDVYEELQRQNQESLRTLDELTQRQEELKHLNSELEDTNRGVMALYSELDEKAVHLRQADETKSRFLSHMSHEFRTPLNSILGLTRLLLNRTDGDLTAHQEKQVTFIRNSAQELFELVNDLLDLAKVEAGRISVRVTSFTASDLFGALRGMFRPLEREGLDLVFDEPKGIPDLKTDQNKVAQILRNFISNALKFTEGGEVRVSARLHPDGNAAVFSVHDTGIGIAFKDQETIFQEFTQLPGPLQNRSTGTGLGLPLSRKLAELLGGSVQVSSQVGSGSEFVAIVPLVYQSAVFPVESGQIMIIDDEEVSRYLLRRHLGGRFSLLEASSGAQGLLQAKRDKPDVIFLDLMMPEMNGFSVLDQLKNDPDTGNIPVVIFTSKILSAEELDGLRKKSAGILSKRDLSTESVAAAIEAALNSNPENLYATTDHS